MKVLLIAGHGTRPNGSFDPGATGLIAKGEHRFFTEDFFPAMKKYAPSNWTFHTDYNVFARGNLVALSSGYDLVLEFHFDAAGAAASGGHIILHPNARITNELKAVRNVIDEMVGAIRTMNGERGFHGRTNLANPNRANNANLNYGLLELGFGTNQGDANVLTQRTDEYARKLVEALTNESYTPKPQAQRPQPSQTKSIHQMAQEIRQGKHGNGHAARQASLGVSNSVYQQVRAEVNRLEGNTSHAEPAPPQNLSQVAQAVINGEYGNNPQREQRLRDAGYNPSEVQNEVNRILSGGTPSNNTGGKTIDQMAQEILNGQHGQGHDNRRRSLGVNQATYDQVRARVNALDSGNAQPSNRGKSIDQMAREVIAGQHGTGHANRRQSLGISQAEYEKVRARVNQLA